MTIKSDRGGEFIHEKCVEFCEKKGIKHQLLAIKTTQQNVIVDRSNRPLVEMTRTLLNDQDLPHKFWIEAINSHATYGIDAW